jgi:integrase/recombinase XerD
MIDRFIDSLWMEAGLARLTLEAYRRDLELYARWLAPGGHKPGAWTTRR